MPIDNPFFFKKWFACRIPGADAFGAGGPPDIAPLPHGNFGKTPQTPKQ